MALVASVTGLGACVGSLYSLYSGPELVSDPRIVGTWTDSTGKGWIDIAASGPFTYRVRVKDEAGKIGEFQGTLGRIGDRLILDVQPNVTTLPVPSTYTGMLAALHAFVLVDSLGEHPRFSLLDTDSLRAWVSTHPAAVRADTFGGGVILEAPPARLQAFLTHYLGRPGVVAASSTAQRCTSCQVPK
jgi:hypothetical protein